jgi:hypothetical protein
MSRRNDVTADSESGPTYMDLLLSGEALAGDIDDFVDAWHEAPDGSTAAALSLAEYLGMTEDEYQLWIEHPDSLSLIAAAHGGLRPRRPDVDRHGGVYGDQRADANRLVVFGHRGNAGDGNLADRRDWCVPAARRRVTACRQALNWATVPGRAWAFRMS